MKCPKCRYVSHDYLDACRKCSTDLVEFKQKCRLMVLRPGDLDLGVLVDVGGEGVADRDRLRVEDATADMLSSVSLMTNGLAWNLPMTKSQGIETELNETTAETAIDIHLDTDNPNTSTEPGELTKTFYVPERLAKQAINMNPPERVAGLDEMAELDLQFDTDTPDPLTENTTALSATAPEGQLPVANPVSPAQDTQHPPVNTIDMSVGHLDKYFDEFEDIQLDTTEIDHDIDLALNFPSISEPQEELFDSAALLDNPADDKLGLERGETDDVPSLSAEQNADTEVGKMREPHGKEDEREI
jgi:hypothetical protein